MFNKLKNLIKICWRDYQKASATMPEVIQNVIPVLWFGDVEAYADSKTKILTVGINPSDIEFKNKKDEKNCTVSIRFPKAKDLVHEKVLDDTLAKVYYEAMNDYFKDLKDNKPYKRWFCWYERVLKFLGASYGGKMKSNGEEPRLTAIHIDFHLPFATNKKWRDLTAVELSKLKAFEKYFDELLAILAPDIILFPLNLKDNLVPNAASQTYEMIKGKRTLRFEKFQTNGRTYVGGTNFNGNPFGGTKKDEIQKMLKELKLI